MSRNGALILLGVLIILTPFSGFPIAFRSAFLVIFGVSVLTIGLSLRRSDLQKTVASEVESHPVPPVEPHHTPEEESHPNLSMG